MCENVHVRRSHDALALPAAFHLTAVVTSVQRKGVPNRIPIKCPGPGSPTFLKTTRGYSSLTYPIAPLIAQEIHMDWRHRAACMEEDPELFFPIGNTGPALLQVEEAKAVCRRCPVIDDCLAWALESGQDAGVWGGLSEEERRALKRRAARSRARSL
jgi:WhiB family transcriptional regulator, redox-sensing transcriptional regulator